MALHSSRVNQESHNQKNMLKAAGLASLLAGVLEEWDTSRALDGLLQAALELTHSRNVVMARLNDELGIVEINSGVGRDWRLEMAGEELIVGKGVGEGIMAYVAATGKSFTTGDVSTATYYRKMFRNSVSEIAVPVRDRTQRVRGVINVESDQQNHYDEEDLQVCELIARLASFALDREQMQIREEALVQIGHTLDAARAEEELIERVLWIAGEVLRFQALSIFLYDPATDRFVLRGSSGSLQSQVGELSYAAGEGVTGSVCSTGEVVLLNNPQKDPRWQGRHLEITNDQIASFLAVPVFTRGRPIGAIRALRRVPENPYLDNHFTPDDQRLLQAIADQVASGLENIRALERTVKIERMAAWGDLSAKSSHMIGNRVFALKGDVNELRHALGASDLDPKHLLELQKSLETNVVRIEEILQEFRDFLTATKLDRTKEDLNLIVRDSVQEVFPRRGKVRLEYELEEGLPPVSLDPRKLRRAITEIVENCLGFFDVGRLRVATHIATEHQLRASHLSRRGRYVCVEIEDQGPGVGQDLKERIFQPFYSSRVKGMGLGLSIVKGIVEAHGGVVYEDGSEGQGALFVILLPVSS